MVFVAFALVLSLLATTACGTSNAQRSTLTAVTYNKDIAPLVFKYCVGCHRPGQLAPFSLLTYQDVKKRVPQIMAATKSGRMPPWLPEPGYGDFANERRLKRDELHRIEQWVKQGSVEGELSDRPSTPTWSEGWQLGTPDLVVELPQAYMLQPGEGDVFRNFVIRAPVPTTRYVRGVEFHPGNPKVIHHAVIAVDRTSASRRLDDEDPEPGYDGMLGEGAQDPDGHFLGWTPGKVPVMERADISWRVDGGTDLVVQLHMMPRDTPEIVQPRIGLFFTDTPPTRPLFVIKLGSKTIDIPAGNANYTVTDSYVLPADVEALSVYPHAHYLAKEMRGFATLSDGTVKWLLWIKQWDFHLQDQYFYAAPVFLPKGTTLTMHYVYDNSAGNPKNPHHPPTRVSWGPHSSDEMGDLWLQVLPRNSTDVATLLRDYVQRERRANTASAEKKVAENPEDAVMRNFLAVQYVQAGRIQDAMVQLEAVLRSTPDYGEAHNNMGNLLFVQGRSAEAIRHFRQALRLQPRNYRVHFNLASALKATGKVDEAIRHFRQTISLNPDFADAHNDLGMALGSQHKIDEAIRHFELALVINPKYADAHNNLGIAVATRGEVDQAAFHFRRALEINPNHAGARKNLSVLLKAQASGSSPR